MSSLLFDDFLYRWFNQDGSWYYGSAAGEGFAPFSETERSYLLSRILSAILTHDLLYIRIAQLEEFIELISITSTLYLLQENVLVVIDDGGTSTAFLPNGDDHLLMNFSASGALKFDAILDRLQKKYIGFTERALLKALVYRADSTRLQADGAWLQQLTSWEDCADLDNGRLTALLDFDGQYSNIIVKEIDTLPLLRLNQANKSLIYQHELNITTLSTETGTQQIIAAKYGSYFSRNQQDPILLFKNILNDKQLPDLSLLYQKGHLSMKDILALRNTFEGRTFRQWLESEDYDRKAVYKMLLQSRKSLDPLAWQSLIRWSVPTIVGVFNTWAGVGLSAIDNFIVNKLLKDWHPNLFLDDLLSRKLENIKKENNAADLQKRQLQHWNRTIGRNDPCPCLSGKKFKHCCGRQ